MNRGSVGGAVFLSNVDDYVNPSQACVNPVFNGAETHANKEQQEQTDGGVLLRRRERAATTKEIVTATIADCLACSGCVTTAETVLMEERHNLEKFYANTRPIVFTISPAALADWQRQFGHSGEIWTAVWKKYLNVWAVIDGNLPLQWSRATAVDEFVQAFRKRKDTVDKETSRYEKLERQMLPSRAIDRTKSEFWLKDGSSTVVEEEPTARSLQPLPLITSSCPAIVCYVEKSDHSLVPHLSTAASAMMSCAVPMKSFFHVAIQPCHDKKLESNRLDYSDHGIDLVLTIGELLELMNHQSPEDWASVASKQTPSESRTFQKQDELFSSLNALKKDSRPVYCTPKAGLDTENTSEPHVSGSGGYADTVFRCAAKELFGIQVEPLWEPVASTTRRGRGRAPNRDFYSASLYRLTDGSYSTTKLSDDATLVWKFGIAYGLQTAQRIFSDRNSYHYIEAMACAGSCLNGAGQLRVGNPETPSETRERLGESRRLLSVCRIPDLAATGIHTRFHMVPAMRHSMGVAAGVSVEDIRW